MGRQHNETIQKEEVMNDEPYEVEDYSDEEYFLAPAEDWFEDLMQQEIPASVVILIIIVLLSDKIFKTVNFWITRKK